MSGFDAERLYQLLPPVYRQRDADLGYPLRDLVTILAREARIVETDIERLFDNWFVETAQEWVVPYIGDLIGVRGLADAGFSRRAEVANTIGYRRRKGTASMLEQLARDVTGWPARVVEYFELLSWTQYLNHRRLHSRRTPDLRLPRVLERIDGPFDAVAHTGEARRIVPRRGRYNIPNIGLYLWRLLAFPVIGAQPREVADGTGRHFRFSALGHDAPLFNHPVSETSPAHVAEALNVPEPIGRRPMHAQPGDYYGVERSLSLVRDGAPVPLAEITVCNLADWQDPPAGRVGVDPVLGRIALPPAEAPSTLEATYHYGFSAPIGGGAYERTDTLTQVAGEAHFAVGVGQDFDTVAAALGAWIAAQRPSAVVTIHDSRSYEETPGADLPGATRLEIRAANGQRPTLIMGSEMLISGGPGSAFEINGLMVGGGPVRVTGQLDHLTLRHVTLVPGQNFDASGAPTAPGATSLLVESDLAEVAITHAIMGPLEVAAEAEVAISDSILDASNQGEDYADVAAYGGLGGAAPGGPLRIARSTVLGTLHTRALTLGENSLFLSTVIAERRQEGCVRFSFVTPDSRVPRRFRCQPVIPSGATPAEVVALTARVRPRFTTLAFGLPEYCQLDWRGPREIWRGAEDESEMGVFSSLKQPQREDNLRTRLDEYLRVGLEAGLFFAT